MVGIIEKATLEQDTTNKEYEEEFIRVDEAVGLINKRKSRAISTDVNPVEMQRKGVFFAPWRLCQPR